MSVKRLTGGPADAAVAALPPPGMCRHRKRPRACLLPAITCPHARTRRTGRTLAVHTGANGYSRFHTAYQKFTLYTMYLSEVVMKRLALVVAIVCMLVSSPAFAAEFMLGAKGGYFVWDPYIKEFKGTFISDMDRGSGFLYGPVMSVSFTPDVTFSVSGLFGEQSTHWYSPDQLTTVGGGGQYYISGTYYVEMDRIDVDSALSYRMTEKMKVFAGYKYQRGLLEMYSTERRYQAPLGDNKVYDSYMKIDIPAHGPALGLGVSQPLGSQFFAAANLSGLYMFNLGKIKEQRYKAYNAVDELEFTGDVDYGTPVSLKAEQIGFNFEPAVGGLFDSAGIVVTLGARLQYTWIKFKDPADFMPDGWSPDIQYGVYLTVLYGF